MTNDSAKFRTYSELDTNGFWLGDGNVFTKGKTRYLPLYEGKMVQMYDHRAAGVIINPTNLHRAAQENPATLAEHQDANFSPLSQYWVDEEEVKAQSASESLPYLIGYKDVTAPTNARSIISAAIPFSGVGNTFCLVQVAPQYPAYCLLANLSSLALDYVARQKIGGQHLNFFIVAQFPVLPPERYGEDFNGIQPAEFVRTRVLELTYTARDMTPFARALGFDGEPYLWDEERRLHLRCQLDALYFLLYGLDAGDTAEILDTFPIVRRTDEGRYDGRYRTRDLILGYRKAYAAGNWDAKVRA